MHHLALLQCVARSAALAVWLAGVGGGAPLQSPPDTDTDTETDADASNAGQKQQLQDLEESLNVLQSSLEAYLRDSSRNRRHDDASALKELATNCSSLCGRILSAVQTTRGPKRIGTSLDKWKTSRSSAGNARQGFELRKISERLQDVQTNLTVQVGKILR